jgi:phage recombination protein Bet
MVTQTIHAPDLNTEQGKIKLLKSTTCKNLKDDDILLFIHTCNQYGLDPFMRQVYAVPRGNSVTIQTSIDGFRLLAERTGKYSPGRETLYNYNEKKELISATAYVKKMSSDGTWHEIGATAFFSEFKANTSFWTKMPHVMLAKCAEAAALRRAFPAELSGLYSDDEMQQAEDSNKKENNDQRKRAALGKVVALTLENEDQRKKILDFFKVKDFSCLELPQLEYILERIEERKEEVTHAT